MKVLCPFGGETGSHGQRGHVTHGAEVKGQRAVVLRVAEETVAVTARVFLPKAHKITKPESISKSTVFNNCDIKTLHSMLCK